MEPIVLEPGKGDIECIKVAMAAIGARNAKTDHRLDLDAHARALRPEAAELRRILEGDAVVRQIQAEYTTYDTRAARARHRFEFGITALSLVIITALMLASFLSSVPPAIEWPVRLGLSIIAGIVLVTLLSAFKAAISVQKQIGWLMWLPRMVLMTSIAFVFYKWIVPIEFAPVVNPTRTALTVVLLACALAADALSGGMLARVFSWIPGFKGRALHSSWYEARGKAEANRRLLFMAVLNAEVPSGTGPPAGTPVPLLSQKLEYFRRYQVEVQQTYYAEKSKDNQSGARRAELARVLAFAAFLLLGFVMAITFLAKLAEQGTQLLPDSWIAPLVTFVQLGGDDVALLLTLFALGSYIHLQVRSSLLRERVNHRRFSTAGGQLRQATSPEPGTAELDVPSPLAVARTAAVRGVRGPVEHFLRAVNRLLAAEVGDWNAMTSYVIVSTGEPPTARLFASDKLTPDDFDRIVADLVGYGSPVFRARKISFVAARQATRDEPVETRYNGKESRDTARSGDWIVTNMDANRELLKDTQNCVNTYVIRAAKFAELYDRDTGHNTYGDIYKAKGVVDAVSLPGGFDIVAPWGELQQGTSGYLLRNGADVYGIHAQAYAQTYKVVL